MLLLPGLVSGDPGVVGRVRLELGGEASSGMLRMRVSTRKNLLNSYKGKREGES